MNRGSRGGCVLAALSFVGVLLFGALSFMAAWAGSLINGWTVLTVLAAVVFLWTTARTGEEDDPE